MMEPLRKTLQAQDSEEHLSEFLFETVRYVPVLAGIAALGLSIIYLFSRVGIFGPTSWQLLAVAAIILLVAATHLPIISLARQRRGNFAYLLYSLVLSVTSILFSLVWQGITLVALLIAWIAPLTAVAAGMRGRRLIPSLLLGATTTAGVIWINAAPPFERLSSNSAAGTAALILLASTVVLFVLSAIVARSTRYRTLQARLIVSFVLIVTVPILFTTVISALNAFTNSQNQFRDTLQAVSSLKQGQINSAVQLISAELGSLRQGSGQAGSILHILDRQGESDETVRLNTSIAATLIRSFMVQHPASKYEEVLVLDLDGNVILSTYKLDEGLSFRNEVFFQQGSAKYFVQLTRFSGKQNVRNDYKLISAAPFYASYNQDVRGVIMAVSSSDLIFNILAYTPGLPNVDTYLVDENFAAVNKMVTPAERIQGTALTNIILGRGGEGSDVHDNYAGRRALGYYRWNPLMQVALVAEIPQGDVISNTVSTLLSTALIGVFTIVIAVIAILSTSRAISDPVKALSRVAQEFSAGRLTARATINQEDEIGKLSNSFNSMADQLQGVIGNLEQRVAERTRDLEQQTLRLRTAAEVARDAASAPGLDELLERASRLIRDRFNLYHTGIFILDDKKEYAVLRASPTEAGRKMLENSHRLRVGEQGIVGRVAATGQSRIALDTGVDPVYFSNPLLPRTHSEMALPLKSHEGVIGVLDIQSDQQEAFTQDDIAIMQVMADQLATAIERTYLLHQVQMNLRQLEQSYLGFTEQSWRSFERGGNQIPGYRYDNVRLEPIHEAPPEAKPALDSGILVMTEPADGKSDRKQSAAIPVRLRGQTIGVINVRFQSARAPEKIIAMIEQVADRLATSLENSRLLEDSLRRANKERVINEITSKISLSINMRNVLQTAVEELGRAIPGSDVMIQFQNDKQVQG